MFIIGREAICRLWSFFDLLFECIKIGRSRRRSSSTLLGISDKPWAAHQRVFPLAFVGVGAMR